MSTPGRFATDVLEDELARWHRQQHIEVEPLPREILEIIHRMPGGGVQAFVWLGQDLSRRYRSVDQVQIAAYDKRQSYLSSARMPLPAGSPERVSDVAGTCSGWELPGLYLVDAEGPSDFPDLPGPFWTKTDEGVKWPLRVRKTWAWHIQLQLARYLGWSVRVHTGYAWRNSHAYLKPWRLRFINALRNLERQDSADAQLAYNALKLAAVSGIGRLGNHWARTTRALSELEALRDAGLVRQVLGPALEEGCVRVLEDRGPHLPLYQPHWRSVVISESNLLTQYTAWKFASNATLGFYVDCIFTEGRQSAIEDFVGKRNRPGGYKLKRVARVSARELGACSSAWELAHLVKHTPEINAELVAAEVDEPLDDIEASAPDG
jgi:hypothetical protein